MMDIDGKHEWRDCLEMPGVRLPRGYYFGTSSITGDLSGTALLFLPVPQLIPFVRTPGLVKPLRGQLDRELKEPLRWFKNVLICQSGLLWDNCIQELPQAVSVCTSSGQLCLPVPLTLHLLPWPVSLLTAAPWLQPSLLTNPSPSPSLFRHLNEACIQIC